MDQDEIAVIIPCFNEAQTIGKVVDDFHRELPEATVYVYDNASTDATAAIAMKHGATVRHEPRRGKGNVCRQMFRDIDAACYLMVDGDDTYPAEGQRAYAPRLSTKRPTWWLATGSPTGHTPRRTGVHSMASAIIWFAP